MDPCWLSREQLRANPKLEGYRDSGIWTKSDLRGLQGGGIPSRWSVATRQRENCRGKQLLHALTQRDTHLCQPGPETPPLQKGAPHPCILSVIGFGEETQRPAQGQETNHGALANACGLVSCTVCGPVFSRKAPTEVRKLVWVHLHVTTWLWAGHGQIWASVPLCGRKKHHQHQHLPPKPHVEFGDSTNTHTHGVTNSCKWVVGEAWTFLLASQLHPAFPRESLGQRACRPPVSLLFLSVPLPLSSVSAHPCKEQGSAPRRSGEQESGGGGHRGLATNTLNSFKAPLQSWALCRAPCSSC